MSTRVTIIVAAAALCGLGLIAWLATPGQDRAPRPVEPAPMQAVAAPPPQPAAMPPPPATAPAPSQAAQELLPQEDYKPQGLAAQLAYNLSGLATNESARELAATVAAAPPDELLAALLRLLDSPVLRTRLGALVVGDTRPNKWMLPLYIAALTNSEAQVRRCSLNYLCGSGMFDESLVGPLKQLLKSETDAATLSDASWLLQEHSGAIDPELAESLARVAADPAVNHADSQGRWRAAWALCKTSAQTPQVMQTLTALYEQGRGQKDETSLTLAMFAAGGLAQRGAGADQMREVLLGNLNHSKDVVRAACVSALSSFAQDPQVRRQVLEAAMKEPATGAGHVFSAFGDFAVAANDKAMVRTFATRVPEVHPAGQKVFWFEIQIASAAARLGHPAGYRALLDVLQDEKLIMATRGPALACLRTHTGLFLDYTLVGPPDANAATLAQWNKLAEATPP
jgi:hypothetical protein